MRSRLALIAAVAGAAGAAGVGCGLDQQGIPPPPNQIFFPGAIAVDPTNSWLYVANSNADLRFNDGTIAVVDLGRVHQDLDPSQARWPICPSILYIRPTSTPVDAADRCCWDLLDSNVLDCDERIYVDPGTLANPPSMVRIGSFASALQIQVHQNIPGLRRLLLAVRGNSSITVVDSDLIGNARPTLSCTAPDGTMPPPDFAECDLQHRISQVLVCPGDPRCPLPNGPPPRCPGDPGCPTTDTPTLLPEEPYAMALDSGLNALYVGHLTGGFLSLIDVSGFQAAGTADAAKAAWPTLVNTFRGIFPPDGNGSEGVTSLTVKTPGTPGQSTGVVYATSRFLPRAESFAAVTLDPADTSNSNADLILADTGDSFLTSLPGTETRGIQFIPGNRAFVLQRNPPALIEFNVDVHGMSLNTAADVIELCDGPLTLDKHSVTGAEDQSLRLYVTCFQSGQVYVIDPYVPRIVAIIEVGRGPSGLAFENSPAGSGVLTPSPRAYVTGFGSNNVSVIDLQPGSPTENHVVQRIGFPSPVPR
jgi:YVTN family beta-propeller protein